MSKENDNYHLRYELAGADETITNLKQQLEEKDKEISKLQTSQRDKTQLAIQELEKVKMQLKDKTKMMSNEEHCYQRKVVSWYAICDQINNQIKELKGE